MFSGESETEQDSPDQSSNRQTTREPVKKKRLNKVSRKKIPTPKNKNTISFNSLSSKYEGETNSFKRKKVVPKPNFDYIHDDEDLPANIPSKSDDYLPSYSPDVYSPPGSKTGVQPKLELPSSSFSSLGDNYYSEDYEDHGGIDFDSFKKKNDPKSKNNPIILADSGIRDSNGPSSKNNKRTSKPSDKDKKPSQKKPGQAPKVNPPAHRPSPPSGSNLPNQNRPVIALDDFVKKMEQEFKVKIAIWLDNTEHALKGVQNLAVYLKKNFETHKKFEYIVVTSFSYKFKKEKVLYFFYESAELEPKSDNGEIQRYVLSELEDIKNYFNDHKIKVNFPFQKIENEDITPNQIDFFEYLKMAYFIKGMYDRDPKLAKLLSRPYMITLDHESDNDLVFSPTNHLANLILNPNTSYKDLLKFIYERLEN